VLGTDDVELARLGLQHQVWRPVMLAAWQRAGITAGWRVADIGAGPGYATVDLAEMVGPAGRVVSVERSGRFVAAAAGACRLRGLDNVELIEADLMDTDLQLAGFDAAWCRWVASFVPSPARLVATVARALRPGGVVVFHEYVDYGTWRLAPRRRVVEEFVGEVMASWRASGGEPDVALALPALLADAGLAPQHVAPLVFATQPRHFVWQWPAAFIDVNLERLVQLGRATAPWAERVREELEEAKNDARTIMITPMVLEIIAVKQ
jgi:SAM-dependent methyltransferase